MTNDNETIEMGDLAGAIFAIAGLVSDRERAEAVRWQRHDDVHDRISHPDGVVEYKRRPAPPRRHVLRALDQVPAFAANCEDPTIWFNESEVVVICDDQNDEHHVSRATLKFAEHDDWTAITELAVRTFSPAELVSFLKFRLWNALDDKGRQFLKAIRRIQFSQQQNTRHQNDVTAKSLGRDVAASVESQDVDLTDFETFRLNICPSTDRTVGTIPIPMEVGFEADPLHHQLTLQPLGGEIDRAVQQFVGRVQDYLRKETDVPSLYGSPE